MADNDRMQRRILHTADLHLGSLGDSACHSLEALVNLAIKSEVDLVIVAGDFFDNNRVDDNLVSFVVEHLQRLPVSMVILPGNHDCLVPDSVYQRANLWKDASNIRVFRALQGETLAFPDQGIVVWGKPIASYAGDVRPLEGIPKHREKGQWHIAVAHGYYVDTEPPAFPSFHITQEEIIASRQDYIALGHMPTFRCVCSEPVKAYYCGSPPISDTVVIVELVEETGVHVTPYSLLK